MGPLFDHHVEGSHVGHEVVIQPHLVHQYPGHHLLLQLSTHGNRVALPGQEELLRQLKLRAPLPELRQ